MDFAGFPSLAGLDRAIAVIVVSEIGDKTFLIAAILSARHSRVTVFAGSLSALAVMSLLSSLLGTILPSLIPQQYTTFAAALLFFVFGAKMVQEGIAMEAGEKGREKLQEEMREVQKEVEEAEEEADQHELGMRGGDSSSLRDLEGGASSSASQAMEMGGDGASLVVPGASDSPAGSRPTSPNPTLRRKSRRNSLTDKFPSREEATKTFLDGAKNLCYLFFSPIFIQSFILTFLAEWGDRSQIATIALAAAHNVWLITLGTTLGHSFCTLLAVLGGRWISQHISIKHITLGGAVLFLLFGFVYAHEAYTWQPSEELNELLKSGVRTGADLVKQVALPAE